MKNNTYVKISFFYIPLMLTSILISSTHSIFDAGISRLPSPTLYLSAFAIAKSVLMLFQCFVASTRQTYATLVYNQASHIKVTKFIFILSFSIVGLFYIAYFTDITNLIIRLVLGAKGPLLVKSNQALWILMPFPLFITFREYLNAIVIRANKTFLITISTIIRFIVILLFVSNISILYNNINQSYIAPSLLFVGVVCECIVMLLFYSIMRTKYLNSLSKDSSSITFNKVSLFHFPLVLMLFTNTILMPIVNAFLAREPNPEINIAAFSVATSLGNIFIGTLAMYHQAIIQFSNRIEKRKLYIFIISLSSLIALILSLISFSSIGMYILRNWIQVPYEVSQIAIKVLRIMIIHIFIISIREILWGDLMLKRKTAFIGRAKITNAVSLTIFLFIILFFFDGAIYAAWARMLAEIIESIYLFRLNKKFDTKNSLLNS